VIAVGAAQHWIAILECVENCSLRDLAIELEFYFAAHAGERAQMMREDNTDHQIKSQ
jgi:hypothetical protein